MICFSTDVRLTSSSRLGRTLPFRNLSENVGNTLTSPRRKVAFSSRGFEANVVGSRKLRVEMAREEKNEWDGSEASERRLDGCRVRSLGRRSVALSASHHALQWAMNPGLGPEILESLEPSSPRSSELHRSQREPLAPSRRTSDPSA
jgi:hypothetical protein